MKMKFFISGISREDAITKVGISLAEISGIEYSIIQCEEYWKIESVYTVLIRIDNKQDIRTLLDNYSDNWLTFGSPIEEYLASDHNGKASFLLEGFLMIQLFL
ncbi:MAG: hypothetical protein IK149_02890 [Oscillospiraceae bacterium]|nr:hypothetical protein [Oscillospiraceae bacterium]